MKRSWIVCAAALLGACAPQTPAPLTQAQLVERGAYLVNNVAGCNDCHTPMTAQGPDMAHTLQGGRLIFAPVIEMPWSPVAPPLAGGPRRLDDAQFATFLQTGVRPDGSHAMPPMPPFRLNEEDALAVVAYIKTLPPRVDTAEPN